MADLQKGNIMGVAAVGGKNINGGGADNAGQDLDNLDTISAMRTRLAAISAGTYTAAYLNRMTYNDMVYAIRVADAPTSVK